MKLEDVKRIQPETYNTKAVAQFLGVSSMTLLNMIKGGKIKTINIAKTGTRPIYGITAEAIQNYYDGLNEQKGNTLSDTTSGDKSIN